MKTVHGQQSKWKDCRENKDTIRGGSGGTHEVEEGIPIRLASFVGRAYFTAVVCGSQILPSSSSDVNLAPVTLHGALNLSSSGWGCLLNPLVLKSLGWSSY